MLISANLQFHPMAFLFQPVVPEEELRSEMLLVLNDKSSSLYPSPTKRLKYSSAVIAPVLREIIIYKYIYQIRDLSIKAQNC